MKTFKLAFFALIFLVSGVVSASTLSVSVIDQDNSDLIGMIEDSPSHSVGLNTGEKLYGDFTHTYTLLNDGGADFRLYINGNVQKVGNFDSLSVNLKTMADVLIENLEVIVNPGGGSAYFGIYSDYILGAGESVKLVFTGVGFVGATYDATLETPIPAAVWLFGSALMGLVGASRRKSSTVVA